MWVSAASGVIRFNGGATFESLFAEPYWLNSVLAIGGEVYVCGDRGMLYRRSATGTWFNLTPSPSTTVSLRVLNGTAVDRLFAAGSGLEASTWVWWAGERWVRAKTNSTSLERATIRTMLVLDDDTMLWGGHDDNIAPLIVRATRF